MTTRLWQECIGCQTLKCEGCMYEDKNEGGGGSTPSQYGIPAETTDLQDLIEHRKMSFALGNIFKACYRFGYKNENLYELNKMKWFVERLIAEEERDNG